MFSQPNEMDDMGDLAVVKTSYWSKPTATIVDELNGAVVDVDS